MPKNTQSTLRLILGDQLNIQHSWFNNVDDNVTYVMFEMRQETDYVVHHIQKIVAFFSAMRAFAKELEVQGHKVVYLTLDDPVNTQCLAKNIQRMLGQEKYTQFQYMQPDEYRVDAQLKTLVQDIEVCSEVFETEHFYLNHSEMTEYFSPNKAHVMESFYRKLRKRFSVLMQNEKPMGERWNFDKENRKKLPKKHVSIQPLLFDNDVSSIEALITKTDIKTLGSLDKDCFIWPLNRTQSLQLFDFFLDKCLPQFGLYQDAMSVNYWSLYHSRLSFALNAKLISPVEVVQQAEAYWKKNQATISLAQIEGFIRQILGWREYMRGMYWANMPEFANTNYFNHQRKLPSFFWDGQTKMKCVSHSVKQSLDYAYAHHIQRLMITGNYMLLSETHPDAADQWYLGIYIDALEWVEMPNTRGMSQFADGGLIATKPYISSANYINKMGDYCSNCELNPKDRYGETACPFNSLYWRFLHKNQDTLRKNMRMRFSFTGLDKMSDEEITAIYQQAEQYLT